MKPYLWQAKELHKFFLDMWQLKDLLAKQRKGKSEIHCEQTAVVSQIHVLQMQKAGRAIFLWKGSLERTEGEQKPAVRCRSIVKERNESGPAAS